MTEPDETPEDMLRRAREGNQEFFAKLAEHKQRDEELRKPRNRHERRMVIVRLTEFWGAEDVVGALVDAGVLRPDTFTSDTTGGRPPSLITDFTGSFQLYPWAPAVWPGGGFVDRSHMPQPPVEIPFDRVDIADLIDVKWTTVQGRRGPFEEIVLGNVQAVAIAYGDRDCEYRIKITDRDDPRRGEIFRWNTVDTIETAKQEAEAALLALMSLPEQEWER